MLILEKSAKIYVEKVLCGPFLSHKKKENVFKMKLIYFVILYVVFFEALVNVVFKCFLWDTFEVHKLPVLHKM